MVCRLLDTHLDSLKFNWQKPVQNLPCGLWGNYSMFMSSYSVCPGSICMTLRGRLFCYENFISLCNIALIVLKDLPTAVGLLCSVWMENPYSNFNSDRHYTIDEALNWAQYGLVVSRFRPICMILHATNQWQSILYKFYHTNLPLMLNFLSARMWSWDVHATEAL